MSYPAYDNKRIAPVQTYDSNAKLKVFKGQKSIHQNNTKPIPQGKIKRAIETLPLWFMIVSLAIWSFTIIGFFVSFLFKLA